MVPFAIPGDVKILSRGVCVDSCLRSSIASHVHRKCVPTRGPMSSRGTPASQLSCGSTPSGLTQRHVRSPKRPHEVATVSREILNHGLRVIPRVIPSTWQRGTLNTQPLLTLLFERLLYGAIAQARESDSPALVQWYGRAAYVRQSSRLALREWNIANATL